MKKTNEKQESKDDEQLPGYTSWKRDDIDVNKASMPTKISNNIENIPTTNLTHQKSQGSSWNNAKCW